MSAKKQTGQRSKGDQDSQNTQQGDKSGQQRDQQSGSTQRDR